MAQRKYSKYIRWMNKWLRISHHELYTVDFWKIQARAVKFHLYGDFFFFFISYTLGLLYLWVSNPQIQPTIDQKQYFRFLIRNPQTQRANCMHCSIPFYMRDFSVRRFWYCRNPGTTTLWIMEYCSQVLGESKVIPEFSLHGVGASNPTLLKG